MFEACFCVATSFAECVHSSFHCAHSFPTLFFSNVNRVWQAPDSVGLLARLPVVTIMRAQQLKGPSGHSGGPWNPRCLSSIHCNEIVKLLGIVKVDLPGVEKLLLNFYPTRACQRLSTFSYLSISQLYRWNSSTSSLFSTLMTTTWTLQKRWSWFSSWMQ